MLCYAQDFEGYERFVDSAEVYIDYDVEKTITFLDSIPKPVADYLTGNIADYYIIKSLIYDEKDDFVKSHQACSLALKYALEEGNYEVAGEASIELFSCFYYINDKDPKAYKHLEDARDYYKLSGYKHGDLEVDITYAYAKHLDGEYEICNALILDKLDAYKSVKDDDVYYYMFATHMLCHNYLELKNLDSTYRYFSVFRALKDNPTNNSYNYNSFEATIHMCFAEAHFENKQMDSTFYYLSKLSKYRKFMADDVEKDFLKLSIESHEFSGNEKAIKAYKDSLRLFENKMYKSIMTASFEANEDLIKTETKLEALDNEKFFNGVLVIVLLLGFTLISFLYASFYRKQKLKVASLDDQSSNLSYLKSNNEKLAVKVQGLEDYIRSLKKEIKLISTIGEVSTQRIKIKELYKNLHLNSSTIIDKSENHLELVNDLNVNFFQKINEMHPQLSNSEIIICYYLYVGFKNKEIAVFLNTSIRAIESKRYRITKKLDFCRGKMTLLDYLKETFKGSETVLS
ncbi:helix-turn-helix transcriptional regulator [Flavivirga eckloniae]|uniref:HTH luxR-type domain-containing protein n=1 Tax=Flavivirga eckloniae TaxID=1803846 RepID=A0A2K9PVM8_9FLAO|nr:LuxR C-terminal-related transcriptional regulator [Flavivirga eckloniae]AUP81113.1 hypothetical protein C1H87_21315 [Flavivirga eckloniae]